MLSAKEWVAKIRKSGTCVNVLHILECVPRVRTCFKLWNMLHTLEWVARTKSWCVEQLIFWGVPLSSLLQPFPCAAGDHCNVYWRQIRRSPPLFFLHDWIHSTMLTSSLLQVSNFPLYWRGIPINKVSIVEVTSESKWLFKGTVSRVRLLDRPCSKYIKPELVKKYCQMIYLEYTILFFILKHSFLYLMISNICNPKLRKRQKNVFKIVFEPSLRIELRGIF